MKKIIAMLVLLAVNCSEIPGPKGDKGERGEKGDNGEPGLTIETSLHCSKMWTVTGGSVVGNHKIYVYSDGSVMTSCELYGGSQGAVSSFNFFKAEQRGASSGYCSVWYGGGWASFEYSNGGSSLKGNGTDLIGVMPCTSN